MINRKGEMTTEQIVMIIVLIVSFLVILFFFFRLNLGGTTNDEICHNSVVLRSKSAGIAGGLTCKTDYVCISGGGSCTNLNAGTTISVTPTDKNAIMKVLADQMADCWYTYGEGKLDYLELNFGQQTVTGGSGCGVCSTIGFDNNIQTAFSGTLIPQVSGYSGYEQCTKSLGENSPICASILNGEGSFGTPQTNEITYKDFIDYLARTPKDNSQTYLQYLFGVSDVQRFINQSSAVADLYNFGVISTSNQILIITGESKNLFPFWARGQFLPPVILNASDVSTYLGAYCHGDFFTQAS
jgi:hypothetical protein